MKHRTPRKMARHQLSWALLYGTRTFLMALVGVQPSMPTKSLRQHTYKAQASTCPRRERGEGEEGREREKPNIPEHRRKQKHKS